MVPILSAVISILRGSPIHHVDLLSCPLILFQGLRTVVPPKQAEKCLWPCAKELPVSYLPFEGEQHGFRIAKTSNVR
ncbi:MAG: hypothetical protein R2911_35015 [Caldilineaceae bacterium]